MTQKESQWTGVRLFDTHFPVLAAVRKADGGIQAPKPTIYGTAFPVLPGLFLTAGHVLKAVEADGIAALGYLPADGSAIKASSIEAGEHFTPYDLALFTCPGLEKIQPIPLEFDRDLTLLDPVWSVGFPCGVDAEWVTVTPRAFRGHVVTRHEHYGLPGQPPCYEVSFPAPEGLSGAPLMMPIFSKTTPPTHRCFGYVIQQATLGSPERQIAVGVAVDIKVLLAIQTDLLELGVLAHAFGREPVKFKPTPIQLPGGMKPAEASADGWPDDEPEAK